MRIEIKQPLDMHLHLRAGAMCRLVAPLSAKYFSGAVIMPNLVPAVATLEAMRAYRASVLEAAGTFAGTFTPLMTLFFKNQTYVELEAARPEIFALKLYPAGATTNSAGGVEDFKNAEPTFRAMESLGIPLLVHGESHGFVMDREVEFLPIYRQLARAFPRLKICMEHITTRSALALLDEFENIFATVTLQHLLITLDDVAGGMLRPHLFCKPIAKRPEDRDALLAAALSGNPKLMFGSDSAPHPVHKKECCGCAAGVFTAPICLPVLADLFAKNGALAYLSDFVGGNARRIHNCVPAQKTIALENVAQRVPECYEGFGQKVVPMFAGDEIAWRVAE